MEYSHFNLQVKFEKLEDFKNVLDDRFSRVLVCIANVGENRNGAYFSKEVLESMIPSLENIPILGFIGKNDNGEDDFKAHEEKLKLVNGGFEMEYLGNAYGFVPTDNKARFEFRYGEDGIEREYLVCEGMLWRKFKKVEEIFNRDGGFKSQSMELNPYKTKGYLDEKGVFVFTQAEFEGLCILGENIRPAVVSSTIERFSVPNVMKEELKEMLSEFNHYFSVINKKGEDEMKKEPEVKVEKEELEAPEVFSATEDELETPQNFKKDEEDELEDKTDDVDDENDDDEDDENENKNFSVNTDEKFVRTFELSHDDIRSKIYTALEDYELTKDSWAYISQVFDTNAIIEFGDKFYKVNYTKLENNVSLGDYQEIYPMFVTNDEKVAIEFARNNFAKLEEEAKELRNFKEAIELKEKQEKLSTYSTLLSEDEFKTLNENLSKFSMKDIEKEIGFLLLQKNHFSAKDEVKETVKVGANFSNNEANPYGELASYFK